MRLRLAWALWLLLPALVLGGSAHAEQVLVLKGSNTITSEGAGWIDVRVPAGAEIDLRRALFRKNGPNDGFHVASRGGAFAGLILQGIDASFEPGRVILGRFDPCDTARCTLPTFNYVSPAAGETRFDTGEKIPRFMAVPAGRYRLWTVGDAPLTIELSLRGLRGTERFVVDDQDAADIKHLRASLGTQGGDTMFASGATFESGTRGILIANLFVEAKDVDDFDWGICAYNGPDAPPEAIAYGPHCTVLVREGHVGAGFSGHLPDLDEYSDKGYFVAQFSTNYAENDFPPNISGRRGLGAWYMTPSEGVVNAGAQGVFVTMPDPS